MTERPRVRGKRFAQEPPQGGYLNVEFTHDSMVDLHREVASVNARLDHLMPLVEKMDSTADRIHGIDKSLAEARTEIRHINSSLDRLRSDLRHDFEHSKTIFWSRFAALAALLMVVVTVGVQIADAVFR